MNNSRLTPPRETEVPPEVNELAKHSLRSTQVNCELKLKYWLNDCGKVKE